MSKSLSLKNSSIFSASISKLMFLFSHVFCILIPKSGVDLLLLKIFFHYCIVAD